MDILGIEHIGVAVGDLAACVRTFEETLGIPCSARERVEPNKVEVAVFDVGNTRIELVAPAGEGSPVSKFLAERGNGLHHICLRVADVAACLDELKTKGVELVDKVPRAGAFGHKVAFLKPKSVFNILIELSEHK
jgi:methylmalonyl-CoA/ethylmalonyl-CoA epimerase